MADFTFRPSLTIKHDTREGAEEELVKRLNNWFNEGPQEPPYENGALLHWSKSYPVRESDSRSESEDEES